MQAAAAARDHVPVLQIEHLVRLLCRFGAVPGSDRYRPAGQSVQEAAEATDHWPAGHRMQLVAPGVGRYVPAAQGVH